MSQEAQPVSWDELLARISQSSTQKCSIRLLDTCFINGKVSGKRAQWYYTTKNGTVAKKKKEKTKADDIASRFGRFALANPNNTDQYVGNLVKPNGQRIYVTMSELQEFLQDTKSFECFGIDYKTFLQVYLRPQDGIDQIVVASYSAGEMKYFLKAIDSTELNDIKGIDNSEFITNQVDLFTTEILNFFKSESLSVSNMVVEYVVDDNGHIWLSRVPELDVCSMEVEKGTEDSPDMVDARKNPPPAPSSEQLPDLPPRTTSSQGRLKNPDIILSPGKLLRKEGGVYKCSRGPDELPGLKAWVLTSISLDNGTEENKWTIDMQQLEKKLENNNENQALRESRSAMRRTASSLMVSFVIKAESLITGDEPIVNEDDLKKKWKKAYEDALVSDSFKLTGGDVKVCGNCEAVIAKLQSLIGANFDGEVAQGKTTPSVSSPLEAKGGVNDGFPSESVAQEDNPSSNPQIDSSDRSIDVSKQNKQARKHDPSGNRKNKKGSKPPKKHIEEGPSMEMLAKFAAERDRQHQKLQEQASQEDNGFSGSDMNSSAVKPHKKEPKKGNTKDRQPKQKQPTNSLLENERKLQELEKLASENASRYAEKIAPDSAISLSEESFLLRQSSQGDVSQYSTLYNDNSASISSPTQLAMSKLDHERDKKVIVQLKEQLTKKDEAITRLQNSLNSRNNEIDALEKRHSELNKRFTDYRNNADEEKDDKIIDLESEILKLKDENSRIMAKVTIQEASDHQSALKLASDSGGNASKGTNALISQLDSLRAELRSVTEKSIQERKKVQTEASIKYLTAEKKHNAEMNELRIYISELEDKISKLEDDVDAEKRKTHALSENSKNLESARAEAVNAQNKLRADLKSMQQSMASTYKMETSQNIGVGVDADTAIKLAEAKSEAKVRQLTNQVEFLKSQLAAELASVEEMKGVVEGAREKADKAKAEFRRRLDEAEKKRVRDVEEMEQITEQKYELRMSELSSLQSKFLNMQNQMQESIQDTEAARQREEMAKTASAKAQSHIAALRKEVERLNDQVMELQEANDGENGTSSEVDKHSHESMMRRLDNERQYLKSQLASEITLKNELQSSLTSCQSQMAEIQRQWTEDVNQLKEEQNQSQQEALRIEQNLKQTVDALRADNERGRSQLEEMKTGFVKMREELRAEQAAMENSRSVKNRLMEELEATKSELKLMKEEEQRLSAMTKEQIDAVTMSTNEMIEEKNKTITRLQESLARQYELNSEAQRATVLCKEELRQERMAQGRKIESIRIYTALTNWKRVRLNAFFQQWQKNSMLCTAAAQFREKMKQVVKRKVDATVQEQEKIKLKAISDNDFEWNEKMEKALTEKDDEITDITAEYEASLTAEKERAQTELDDQVEALKKEHEAKLQELMDKHQEEVSAFEEKRKEFMQEQKRKFKDEMAKHSGMLEQKAYQEKLEAVSAREKELLAKYNDERVEVEDDYEDKLRELKKAHQLEMSNALYEAEKEKQGEAVAMKKQFESDVEELKKKHSEALSELSEAKDREREEALQQAKLSHEESISATRQECHEQNEERVRLMRGEWEEELRERLSQQEAKFESSLEVELQKASNAATETKNKMVRLETTKWQQVLKEAEKRFQVEVKQSYQKGFSDCEKKMKEEMASSAEACKRDISLSEEKNKHALETLRNEYEQRIESLDAAREVAIREKEKETEDRIRGELAEEMREYVQKKVDEGKEEVTNHYEKRLEEENSKYLKLQDDKNKLAASSSEKTMQLQSEIEMLELRLKHNEMSSFDQITKLEQDLETEREDRARKEKTIVADLRAQLEEEHAENMTKLSAELEAEAVRRVDAEKSRMNDLLEQQMNELQDENEKLITGLEAALSDLKKQKMEVTDELESTTTKLETAEDTLYDSQQAMAALQKRHSISTWRFSSRLMNMNVIFKRELSKTRSEAAEEVARAEHEGKAKLEDLVMLGMKLSDVIRQVQEAREKVYHTLTTYKSDVLIEKRTHIKLFEKEISRLADEKELMDDQRDTLEEELVQYEKEVESIEAEIREHTRSSSVMQNGRINVAHARKKKRFDTELERILDLIEQKRSQINDMDDRCQSLMAQKDDKEADLADLEKELVQILIEQQRMVLSQIEEAQSIEDKGRTLLTMSVIPWPPVVNPTKEDIAACLRRINKRYKDGAPMEE